MSAFGEDQGRYLIAVSAKGAEEIASEARAAGLPLRIAARLKGTDIVVPGEEPLPLSQLKNAHEAWFPGFMAGSL